MGFILDLFLFFYVWREEERNHRSPPPTNQKGYDEIMSSFKNLVSVIAAGATTGVDAGHKARRQALCAASKDECIRSDSESVSSTHCTPFLKFANILSHALPPTQLSHHKQLLTVVGTMCVVFQVKVLITGIRPNARCQHSVSQSIPQSIARLLHGDPDFWLSAARSGVLG